MKYLIPMLLIANVAYADSSINQTYSYSSTYPQYGEEKPLTPVGSDIKTVAYSVPQDTSRIWVSKAIAHPTDIPKEVEAPKLQAQIAALNAKMDAVHAALLTAESKAVTGTMVAE